MANAMYIGSSGAMRRRRAIHRLRGPERALMRLKLKRLPHPILTAEQLRTAFRGTLMAVAHHVRRGAHCGIEKDIGLRPK